MQSVAFVVPWEGKLPEYFALWLMTCGNNPSIDFLVFTDDTTEYQYPTNVKPVYFPKGGVGELIQKNFNSFIKASCFWHSVYLFPILAAASWQLTIPGIHFCNISVKAAMSSGINSIIFVQYIISHKCTNIPPKQINITMPPEIISSQIISEYLTKCRSIIAKLIRPFHINLKIEVFLNQLPHSPFREAFLRKYAQIYRT